MTPEGRVKNEVNKGLKEIERVWRFMPVSTGYGLPSLDYLLCVGGRFVAIETKVKGKKLTPRQELTKGAIEAAGGIVLVVDDKPSCTAAMQTIRDL